MIRMMRVTASKFLLALTTTLCAAAWAVATAGEVMPLQDASAQASPAPAPLQDLDEVWVHGKRLADRIETAEDDFFHLYNALNEDDRFDVRCGMMALHAGSMIMQRTCIPGFLANRVPLRAHQTVYYRPARLTSQPICHPPVTVVDGSAYFEGGCYGQPWDTQQGVGAYYQSDFGSPGLAPSAAPIQLEALHYREEYAANVLAVIQSDARLVESAGHLAALYHELEATQQHYRELKAATPLAWSFSRPRGGPGPRGR